MGIYAVISPHVQRDQELVSAVSRAQCQLEGTIEKLKKELDVLRKEDLLWAIEPTILQREFPARIDRLELKVASIQRRVERLMEVANLKPLSDSTLCVDPPTPSLFGEDTK
ncbi:hypothetical protein ABG067_004105 [Albugo candida]